jgi:hypothetical protein
MVVDRADVWWFALMRFAPVRWLPLSNCLVVGVESTDTGSAPPRAGEQGDWDELSCRRVLGPLEVDQSRAPGPDARRRASDAVKEEGSNRARP